MKKINKLKQNKGITLIALVITIIVLLILAGVSISAITGNDSAMEKAKQAKTENEKGDELDTIKLAVVDAVAHGDTGFVTLTNLQNAVKDLDGITAEEGKGENIGKFVVMGKQNNYVVSTNGQVEKFSGLSISSVNLQIFEGETETLTATVAEEVENKTVTWTATDGAILIVNNTEVTSTTTEGTSSVTVKAVAGKIMVAVEGEETKTCIVVVKNMPRVGDADSDYVGQFGNKVVSKSDNTAYTAGGISTWRLFYKDSDYAYLISDSTVGSYKPSTEYTDSTTDPATVKTQYADGSKVSSVGKGLNYGLIAQNSFVSSNTKDNIRTVAWMTDTSATGPWASYKGPDAEYAIGSPTIKLFVASYNAVNGANTISCTPSSQAGYSFRGSGFSTARHNIWAGKGNWWLASPYLSNYGSDTCVLVYGSSFSTDHVNYAYAVRPLVMIPASTFEAKYATVD